MKRLISASIASLVIALAGCSGEAEETPDITEAIPLDPVEETQSGADDDGARSQLSAGAGNFAEGEAANGSDTPDLPGAPSAGSNSGAASNGAAFPSDNPGGRALPDTMETGRNPEGMTTPPAGSKVQRAG